MRRNMPPKGNFIGATIPPYQSHVIKEHIASGANDHTFLAHSDKENSSLAFKIVPISNLVTDEENEQYLEEARRANTIEHQVAVRHIQVVNYFDSKSSTRCVVFICEHVNGPSLDRYLEQKDNRGDVDLPFIRTFLETMLGLLFELQARGYQHGDLHAGNILVVKSQFDIEGRVVFKVTDFGVRNFIDASQRADDFLNIAGVLRRLLECIDFREESGLDRYIFIALRDRFLKRLLETDPTIDKMARKPREILDELRALEAEYREAQAAHIGEEDLATPFDYPNCEQIGDSNLMLRSLYSNRLLELSKIEAHTNVVLTGPRGCGKTTVFRALSLAYLMSTRQDAPDAIRYIGIYYRCDDLYFAFPRYVQLDRVDAIDIPMHFLIVTLLSTLLRELHHWASQYYAMEWALKGATVVGALWDIFEWSRPSGPNALDLFTLARRLEKERHRAERTYRYARRPEQNISGFFGPGMMIKVCKLLRTSFSFLRERVFHFYIDDYSHPKITRHLQANLNRLLMHRSADVFFKISTESPVSFVRHDMDGKAFAEAREYDFINLGIRYITGDLEKTSAFIRDLFARRFRAVPNYPVGNLRELLGSLPRNENARARVARGTADGTERIEYRYLYGEEVVSLMCSGDIHHMIRLVSRMVDDFGGPESLRESGSPIPPKEQQRSIRKEAGAIMESIRTVPEVGPRLANVAAAFGKVAKSYLRRDSRNQKGNPPHQASKIEPYEALDLSLEAEHIREELLRYSVFIEDPKGRSRRGNVVPRFFLRRSLIPHFGLTFSRRDSVELENDAIELLLLKPERFGDKHRIKGVDEAALGNNGDMFDE